MGNIIKTPGDAELLAKWIEESVRTPVLFRLLWRGSRDGFEPDHFHTLCNDQGPTLTIVQNVADRVFGGYTSCSWKSDDKHIPDPTAFLYSLSTKVKYPVKDTSGSICGAILNGPAFRHKDGSSDLLIEKGKRGLSNSGGQTYGLPSDETLAGSYTFEVKEIEVYAVIK